MPRGARRSCKGARVASAAGSQRERRVLAAAAAAAVATTAFGLLYEATGRVLGTALPPFVAGWLPRADVLWLVLAVLACAALTAAVPRLLRAPARPATFAAALFALGLAVVLAVNAARTGTGAWSAVLDPATREGRNEYLAALGALEYGPRFFLDRFAELVPALPPHAAAHPPGLLVSADALGLATPARLAAVLLACAAALGPLAYALARRLDVEEPRARLAGVLTAASPCVVLFGGTSADALFAVLGLVAALGLAGRSRRSRAAGAVALAVAALFAWSLLAVGAWAAVLAWRRDGLRAALALAAACGVAVLTVQGLLAAATGYDPVGVLRATEDVYRDSLARIRPYWFWWIGSPVAWAVTAGPVLVGAAMAGALRRHAAALAIAVVVVVAAVAGFSKAEVERIWLPFVPLAAVAAAQVLPPGRARLAVATLLAQALLTQVLFETVW